MVCQAKEAQDIEAVDDWFSESMSEMQKHQTDFFRQLVYTTLYPLTTHENL